jgi:haloalkane dehalogenase
MSTRALLVTDTPRKKPAAAAHRDALGLRIRSTTVAGAHTTFVDEGSGPVVLLLHGAPMTSLGFVRVIRELKRTHRVIAPDFPGFGGSETSDGFGGTLDEHAAFVARFVDGLRLRDVVMFVNDSSGCIGLSAAARLPPGSLKGIVVADTVPIPLTGAAWFVGLLLRYVITSRVMRWLNRRLNLLPWLVATVAPWMKPFSKVERNALVREFDTAAKRDRILDLFERMAVDGSFMEATAERVRERLADLPALILYGQFDPMRIIGGAARFRAMFPKSRVAIVPWEEHFPILSSGAKVGQVMRDWMASHE